MKYTNDVLCPICSQPDSSFFLSGRDYLSSYTRRFTLVKCAGCGLIRLDPQQEPEDGQALYQPDYYREMKGISKILETLFLNERKRIVEKFKKPPGALLDLGCGTGGFLKVMARGGWKAQGIEKSDKIKKYSTEENKIYCADLLDMKFDGGSFDVITLWQVLEHLSDPKKYLAEINRLLKEDGILVVSVPNIGSMQAKFGANKWFHLDVPRHIWHFTPETVSELLRRAGFRVKEIKHFSLEYNSFGWWQSIFNLLGCEINFIYKYLKRGAVQKEYATAKRIYTILCAVLLSLLFLLFAFILSFIESALLRGGVITVVAEKGGDI